MITIISLSRDKQKGVRTIEATFMEDGELKPLRVSEDDRPEVFHEISRIIETPNVDIKAAAEELFALMSPAAKVHKQIVSSYHLSDNLKIKNGQIVFGEFVLEETLASHMLSLLDEEEVPKDEKLWKSYIRFLDNLHQNVNEDIRKQLFRWMDYERRTGNHFAITEDGCFVGYKGCQGTILEPMSVFTGKAIVDGEDFEGHIPNRVGSVVQMPRATVQNDPSIGCAQGLHVGTRDYATAWAPILILVKVNPRDVVSVPYECDSQKIRVCEYTVLKVTDATEEHKMFHPNLDEDYDDYEDYEDHEDYEDYEDYEDDEDDEDYCLNLQEAKKLLYADIYVEYDEGESVFRGTVVDIYEDGDPGVIMKDEYDNYKHIKLYRINYYEIEEIEEIEESEDTEEDEVFPDYSSFSHLAILNTGDLLEIQYKYYDGTVDLYRGHLLNIDMKNGQLLINEEEVGIAIVKFEDMLSIKVVK